MNSKYISTRIQSIENEKDISVLSNSIMRLESILEVMNPMKCDFNYQKLIPLLFSKLKLVCKDNQVNHIFISLYFHFNRIFPDIKVYLSRLFNIHTIFHFLLKICFVLSFSKYMNFLFVISPLIGMKKI